MNGIQAARAAYANRGGANNSNNQQQYRDEDYDINNPLGNNNAVNKTKVDEAMKILAEDEPDLKEVNFLRVEAEELADISMEFEVIMELRGKS